MRIETNNQVFGIKKNRNFNDNIKRGLASTSTKNRQRFHRFIYKIKAEQEKKELVNRQRAGEQVLAKIKTIIENKNK